MTTTFADQGDPAAAVREALEDIEDDAFRRGGVAAVEDVEKAATRFDLSASERSLLAQLALQEGLVDLPEAAPDSIGTLSRARVEAMAGSGAIPETLTAYLDRISRVPLISAVRERELARALEAGEAARSTGRTDPLTVRVIKRGEWAKREFVQSNLRLVVHLAKVRRGQGLDFVDLIQYGTLGLIRAVEKFDWRMGFKFSTYATWWIRQSIDRALADYGRVIRLPVHRVEMLKRIHRERGLLRKRLGRDPEVPEIATAAEADPAMVAFLLDANQAVLSLDAPLSSDPGSLLRGDVLPSTGESVEQVVERSAVQDSVRRALGMLTDRERHVVEMRFGIGAEEPRTLEDVGRTFNVTRERIRQIETVAKQKLESVLREQGLENI